MEIPRKSFPRARSSHVGFNNQSSVPMASNQLLGKRRASDPPISTFLFQFLCAGAKSVKIHFNKKASRFFFRTKAFPVRPTKGVCHRDPREFHFSLARYCPGQNNSRGCGRGRSHAVLTASGRKTGHPYVNALFLCHTLPTARCRVAPSSDFVGARYAALFRGWGMRTFFAHCT